MIGIIPKRNPAQLRIELRAMKKAGSEISKSPARARAFLLKHGLITKSNKVSKHYR